LIIIVRLCRIQDTKANTPARINARQCPGANYLAKQQYGFPWRFADLVVSHALVAPLLAANPRQHCPIVGLSAKLTALPF